MLIDDVHTSRAMIPAVARGLVPDQPVVVDVNPVARYIEQTVIEQTMLTWRDLPNVAPIAPRMWCEYAYTGAIGGLRAVGVQVLVFYDRLAGDPPFTNGGPADGVRWVLLLHHWADFGARIIPSKVLVQVHVRGDGQPVDHGVGSLDPGYTPDEEEEATEWWHNHIALTALCFAHCKGVTLTDHRQPRQQRRSAERAGRPPLVMFKTIDIAPVTRLLREDGEVEKVGIKKALHMVRGHFAHYTDEKPLFGKLTGTFYIPLHVRGTAERGAVVKDYRVPATEEQQRMAAP